MRMEGTWRRFSTFAFPCGCDRVMSSTLRGVNQERNVLKKTLFRLFSMLMSMVKPFLSENVANNVTLHSGGLATLRKHFRYLLSNSHRILNSNLLDLHRKKGV